MNHTGILTSSRSASVGCFAIGHLLSDQQATQSMQVATRNSQGYVSFVPEFSSIAASLLPVAGLQRADCGLHTRVILPSCKELIISFGQLPEGLFRPRLGKAQTRHND